MRFVPRLTSIVVLLVALLGGLTAVDEAVATRAGQGLPGGPSAMVAAPVFDRAATIVRPVATVASGLASGGGGSPAYPGLAPAFAAAVLVLVVGLRLSSACLGGGSGRELGPVSLRAPPQPEA